VAERAEVVFVDGVRTPFGRAGEKGMYWNTRADDLVVKAMIGLLERNPKVPGERIDDVAIAATTQASPWDEPRRCWPDSPSRFPASRSTACAPAR